jgi:hypothetical protein
MTESDAIDELSRLITEWGMSFYVRPALAALVQANTYLLRIDYLCTQFPALRDPVYDLMKIYTLTH